VFDKMKELQAVNDKIAQLVTERLRDLAAYYLIPLPAPQVGPPEDDREPPHWVRSTVSGRFHLAPASAVELRATINKEEKEKSERFFRRLSGLTSVIAALTGIGGVAIGLILALHGVRH
jgi:hypothetical protein